jgi:two-component system chemotaxis sensor kinase CheA
MSDVAPLELTPELLDDFYAECDEHLGNLRTQLARLEPRVARGELDGVALESLFRSVHSFKGNAAIVGLAAAEQLAHALEALLRRLSRREVFATPALLDLVGRAGHRLEQVVATFRLSRPIPATADLLEELKPFAGSAGVTAPTATTSATGAEPSWPEGTQRWRAVFSPTPELDSRGINLAAIRKRLAELGSIVRGEPKIHAGGRMSFVFNLALTTAPTDLAAWEADGVQFASEEVTATPSEADADVETAGLFIAPSRTVRVDLDRLDNLMRIAGELVIHRSRLEDRIARSSGDRSSLQEVNLGMGRTLRDLREALTRIRLVPIAEIFSRLPFVVRDLARATGKEVRLDLEGQETEIDKFLVERLKEPLLHLVRNALSHGIESPSDRAAAGKPRTGTLTLRARAAADGVVIQVSDDGRGVDPERVAARARAAGLAVPEEMDDSSLLQLICTPGFSTQEHADRAAGRGVGMAVVASTIRELGGTLSLTTASGQSTCFTLRLPLTLSIAETFIVSAAAQVCAVPQGCVEEIVEIANDDVRLIRGTEVVAYREGLLPLVRLGALFNETAPARPRLPVLVIASERGSAGLVVDRVHAHREVVVRPIRDPLIQVPGVVGATELGDGRPVLILNAMSITEGVVRPHASRSRASVAAPDFASASSS